jgi:hypothetical protein
VTRKTEKTGKTGKTGKNEDIEREVFVIRKGEAAMANELETSLRNAAARIAQYVEDVATLTVETRYIQVSADGNNPDFAEAKPAARTIIKLDSDSTTTVPMRSSQTAGVLEVDAELLAIHQANVDKAIEYRARMLDALLGILRSRLK